MKWMGLSVMLLFLGACTHLPAIHPAGDERLPSMENECRSHFPRGRWQLVHTITVRLPGGRQATFTGAVVMSTQDASIHCVLMSLEGMVLFEAEAVGDEPVTVKRAFGPFANDHFAGGVMADIRFLFLEPDGGIVAAGTFDDGGRGCRYRDGQGRVVDLIQTADGAWRMRQSDERGAVLRSVTAESASYGGFSPRMVLDAGHGRQAYTLTLQLVEAVELP